MSTARVNIIHCFMLKSVVINISMKIPTENSAEKLKNPFRLPKKSTFDEKSSQKSLDTRVFFAKPRVFQNFEIESKVESRVSVF